MKKYFSKYLPVPEEIKEGDLFKDTAGNIRIAEDIDIQLEAFLSSRVLSQSKVKLFLCSRDVKKGDIIRAIDDSELILKSDNDKLPHDYKVVGEISPEALWVKEGMEFEKKDINTGWFIDGKLCYTIKGPCGHFH